MLGGREMRFQKGKLNRDILRLQNIGVPRRGRLNDLWEKELSKSVADVLNNILEDDGAWGLSSDGTEIYFTLLLDERVDENNPCWTMNFDKFLEDCAFYVDDKDGVAQAFERAAKRIRHSA